MRHPFLRSQKNNGRILKIKNTIAKVAARLSSTVQRIPAATMRAVKTRAVPDAGSSALDVAIEEEGPSFIHPDPEQQGNLTAHTHALAKSPPASTPPAGGRLTSVHPRDRVLWPARLAATAVRLDANQRRDGDPDSGLIDP